MRDSMKLRLISLAYMLVMFVVAFGVGTFVSWAVGLWWLGYLAIGIMGMALYVAGPRVNDWRDLLAKHRKPGTQPDDDIMNTADVWEVYQDDARKAAERLGFDPDMPPGWTHTPRGGRHSKPRE